MDYLDLEQENDSVRKPAVNHNSDTQYNRRMARIMATVHHTPSHVITRKISHVDYAVSHND